MDKPVNYRPEAAPPIQPKPPPPEIYDPQPVYPQHPAAQQTQIYSTETATVPQQQAQIYSTQTATVPRQQAQIYSTQVATVPQQQAQIYSTQTATVPQQQAQVYSIQTATAPQQQAQIPSIQTATCTAPQQQTQIYSTHTATVPQQQMQIYSTQTATAPQQQEHIYSIQPGAAPQQPPPYSFTPQIPLPGEPIQPGSSQQGYIYTKVQYIPPEPIVQEPTVVQQADVTHETPEKFGQKSLMKTCSACHVTMYTYLSYQTGKATWVAFFILILIGVIIWPVLFFCWVPFCLDSCKDVVHHCSNCHRELGRYQLQYKT